MLTDRCIEILSVGHCSCSALLLFTYLRMLGGHHLVPGGKHPVETDSEPHRPRLRPSHVQGSGQHGRHAPITGTEGLRCECIYPASRLQPHRYDQQVPGHLGGGGSSGPQNRGQESHPRDQPHDHREHRLLHQLRGWTHYSLVDSTSTYMHQATTSRGGIEQVPLYIIILIIIVPYLSISIFLQLNTTKEWVHSFAATVLGLNLTELL